MQWKLNRQVFRDHLSPSVDVCDVAETCSGSSGDCPSDGLETVGGLERLHG